MADVNTSFELLRADLASGDAKSLALDCGQLDIARIESREHPLFPAAYERLWAEFGPPGEMESRDVLTRRLAWNPAAKLGDFWLRYEMIHVAQGGRFAAARDHTAIVMPRDGQAQAVVHLSHILVDPAWRRTGLAGWLRAWPIQTARACLATAGFPVDSPITLVLEMEHPDPRFEKAMVRIKAYEKAGFKKVDPAGVKYFQPDFRAQVEIDATGGPRPLPFCLLVRRIGREQEQDVQGGEVRQIVEALYHMYGVGCREEDMAALWRSWREYPEGVERVALVPPSQ